jgi:hypothetical protein
VVGEAAEVGEEEASLTSSKSNDAWEHVPGPTGTTSALTAVMRDRGGWAARKARMSLGVQLMIFRRSSSACSRFMLPSMACAATGGAAEQLAGSTRGAPAWVVLLCGLVSGGVTWGWIERNGATRPCCCAHFSITQRTLLVNAVTASFTPMNSANRSRESFVVMVPVSRGPSPVMHGTVYS